MFRWIESIRVVSGIPQNLYWHQKRMDETFEQFAAIACPFSLHAIFNDMRFPQLGLHKLRIVYNLNKIEKIEISAYSIREISGFYLVERNDINYSYKFEDRTSIDSVNHSEKEPIIVKQGLITDTRYSNLIFKKGNYWYTPSTFLLNGTMRQKLLREGSIQECKIGVEDLFNYSHFKLINAMMPPEQALLYNIALLIRG